MFLIDKKLIFIFIIYLNQYHIVCGEQLKGYYFNKSANRYYKIESTSTTAKPPKLIYQISSTTTESTKRIDDFKKIANGQLNHAAHQSTNVQLTNSQMMSQLTNAQSDIPTTTNVQTEVKVNAQLSEQNNNHTSTKISSANQDQDLDSIERPKINMLDFISGMSKAIHLLIYQRDPSMKNGLDTAESTIREENQTSTREPISIFRPLKVNSKIPPEGLPQDYRAQAELLRQQILRRCNQLQNIISTTNEILRERENHMFAKILENFSTRIEHTKMRADLILKEPSTSVTAVKALNRINYGLNNLNHLVQNVLSRVNVSINLDMKENQKETKREAKKVKNDNKSIKKDKKEPEKVQQ